MLLLVRVEPFLQRVENHAIGAFNLAISPGVRDRDILNRDTSFVVEVLEIGACERGPQISDDAVRKAKLVNNVIKQLNRLLRCSLD